MAIVYRHIRLDKNEPFYIGIGKNTQRAKTKSNRNNHWLNVVSKTDYEVEILFENISSEQAIKKEIELILLYGRKDLNTGTLVNMTDGGEGIVGFNHKQQTKDKISKSHIGKTFSKESRDKMSKSKTGDLSPTKQQWVKDKISKTLTGFIRGSFSKEHIKKLSDAKKTKVIHIKTNVIYDSIKDACFDLNLIHQTEYGKMKRNSKNKNFKVLIKK